jgi:hypothetical protein
MMRTTIIDVDQPRGPLVRWGAIVAGAVWGLAIMTVLSALWLAVAFPSDVGFVRDNLEWFIAGSGGFSLFVAGLLAGLLTDNRGPGSGWLHGMTAWGVLVIGAIVFGLPSIFGLFGTSELRAIGSSDLLGPGGNDALWASFLTLVVGAVAAAFGGLIGGAPRRSLGTAGRAAAGTDVDVARDDRAERSREDRTVAIPDDDAETNDDRVTIRRAEDGTYVDGRGRRYVPEGASTSSRTDV